MQAWRGTVRWLAAAAAGCGLAACGGGVTTVTVVPTTSAPAETPTGTSISGGGASSTATSAATPAAPAPTLVWAVTDGGGAVSIRAIPPGGGPAHAVVSLAAGHLVLAFGHGLAVLQTPDHHILTVDVATGARRTHPGGAGTLFGAAFDDTGRHLAYVEAVDPSTIRLRVLDLTSDAVTTVRSLGNEFVAPRAWTGQTIAGPVVVGFSDAPQQGARAVSATSGLQTGQTQVPAGVSYTVFGDAAHGAATSHASLGDDADAQPGPGPQGPFNTLSTFTIGASAHSVLSEPHHSIGVLDGTSDGGTLLIDDTAAAGGFAGISQSPDFGVFLLRGAARTQLAHVGSPRLGGALLQDGASAAVAERTASGAQLIRYSASGTPQTIDTAAGAEQAEVALVAAG